MAHRIIPNLTREIVNRFWKKVKMLPNGCWEWQAAKQSKKYPYGVFKIGRKTYRATRVAYRIYYGVDPGELDALHRCDWPPCTCPLHLFLGTDQDNTNDRVAKGRPGKSALTAARGEKNGAAKVTEDVVRKIRIRYASGEFQGQIARAFNISRSNVGLIVRREKWKHIL